MVQWRPEVLIIKNEDSDHDDEEGDILTTLCIDTVKTFTGVWVWGLTIIMFTLNIMINTSPTTMITIIITIGMGRTFTGGGVACRGGSPKAQRLWQAGESLFVFEFQFRKNITLWFWSCPVLSIFTCYFCSIWYFYFHYEGQANTNNFLLFFGKCINFSSSRSITLIQDRQSWNKERSPLKTPIDEKW